MKLVYIEQYVRLVYIEKLPWLLHHPVAPGHIYAMIKVPKYVSTSSDHATHDDITDVTQRDAV